MKKLHGHGVELWGGVECTVNRVGDVYFDQMERNGHATRVTDLSLFAGLGIRAIRYPVLWEKLAPKSLDEIDWSWPDERLETLRELDVRPIVGLTHHGSGPRHTSLVDDSFATGLAAFAARVAERYPWVDAWTPVNEPLTTARFSGLYGHWYPHARDDRSFARALFTECRAVSLAMQAIRKVNPSAKLVQTEDLGRVYSTPRLEALARFFGERRWLSLDLLCGRVVRGHPLYERMLSWGIAQAELEWLAENPCPPDIVGVNHYASSDRFLDHEVQHYEPRTHVQQDGVRYADVEAVRAGLDWPVGVCGVLQDVWDRYKLPMAITEAHLGSTREEQMRWLKEFWDAAVRLREQGLDVRAVTVWSLLGSYDWNKLVTTVEDFYEPGPLDVRGPAPRQTALARLMRDLSAGRSDGDDPLLALPGWWRRPDRLLHPRVEGRSYTPPPAGPGVDMEDRAVKPLLILGGSGALGEAFARMCDVRGIAYHLLTPEQLSLSDPRSVDRALEEYKAWALVDAGDYGSVDAAEHDVAGCMQRNTSAPAMLATACARHGVRLVTFSSDLVFDGRQGVLHRPYVESDPVAPLNVYGRSKARMEARVLEILPSALVVRTSATFSPWDAGNFVARTLAAVGTGTRVVAADDAVVSPTYVLDLVHATLDLLVDHESGIWHLANRGAVTWAALAQHAVRLAGLDTRLVEGRPTHMLANRARLPRYTVLGSERGSFMPALEDALRRYLRDRHQTRPVAERRRAQREVREARAP